MKQSSLPQAGIVKKIIKENFKTKTFVIDAKITANPGQFIMVWLPEIAEKPFSLTTTDPLSFTVMSVGKFTRTINTKIKPGDKIWYRGPLGKGFFKNKPGKKILVSGGCGCVPVYCFARTLKDKKNTTVIIGAKNKKELLFVNKFKKLGFKVMVTTDDGSQGCKGFTTDILKQELEKNKNKVSCVYSCGPDIMLRKVVKLCLTSKVKFQVSLEALMKCGFGICGSCSRGGKLVCKDGPVFSKWPGKL